MANRRIPYRCFFRRYFFPVSNDDYLYGQIFNTSCALLVEIFFNDVVSEAFKSFAAYIVSKSDFIYWKITMYVDLQQEKKMYTYAAER